MTTQWKNRSGAPWTPRTTVVKNATVPETVQRAKLSVAQTQRELEQFIVPAISHGVVQELNKALEQLDAAQAQLSLVLVAYRSEDN